MEIRTLKAGERGQVLDLLDCWELPDGWRGRDFFRRYMEQDPSFRDENFWVAEERERLVCCVQIFPRAVRVGTGAVPMGGIGSVFTHPDARSSGTASAVLRRAEEAMRERGMSLGMLFTGRVGFYERLGWRAWPLANALYIRQSDSPPPEPDLELGPLDAGADLEAAKRIHAHYSAQRMGSVVRDDAGWEGNLRVSGNPDEDFRVARRDGVVVGYARFIALENHPILAEFGRGAADADALASLLAAAFAERGGAYGPAPADPELEQALAARGIEVRGMSDPNAMLRCLDAKALCAASGVDPIPGENDGDLLRRVLPPERSLFWPSDRF
ncbi:MAG: GNAT family N-acetyltransferase [Deltaproteobacteria bacterium]|nr:GNAT family N-acetyltransferase [Deltaproteobacteria bacterium]